MTVANFIPKINGLSVEFLNASTGNPLTFDWDFNDGNTSTDENPINTYDHSGYYTVSLTVINTDNQETSTKTMKLGISEFGTALSMSIIDFVNLTIPSQVTIDTDIKANLLQKWQAFIQPVVKPTVAVENTYNEFAYSALANNLIYLLISYEILINGANKYLIGLGGGQKEIKAIGTDPATAEWFSTSEVWASVMSKGGLFQQLQGNICALASRLDVPLQFCPELSRPVIIPKVFRKHHHPHGC